MARTKASSKRPRPRSPPDVPDGTRAPASFVASNLHLFGFGSSDALMQAVRELTENALDSGAARVCVRLRAVPPAEGGVPLRPGGWALWEVSVEDDGRGVAAMALLHGVFSTTKAGGGAAAPAPGAVAPALGRYGVGLKAAILFAQGSVEALLRSEAAGAAGGGGGGGGGGGPPAAGGSPLLAAFARCPLLVATSRAGEPGVRAARVGVDAAGGAAREEPAAAPARVRAGGGGTAAALTFAFPAGTPASAAAARELLAYGARLALAPARRASVWLSLDCEALAALLPPRGGGSGSGSDPAPPRLPPPADVLPWQRAPAPPPAARARTLLAEGEPSADPALHRFALCVRSGLPAPCVARGEARAAGGARVTVWALLTPVGAGPAGAGGGGGGGAPRGLVHVLRFAEGVPLLRGAPACALTRGVTEGVAWAAQFGFSVAPLQPSGGGGGRLLSARAAAALLERHPAAPAPAGGGGGGAGVDGPGAFLAAAAVAGRPGAPFEVLRLLVDARAGGGTLHFGDLCKTHLAEGDGEGEGEGEGGGGGGGALAGGGASLAAAAADAALAAMVALRAQQPAGALLPAEEQQRALLVKVYLPGAVAALEGAVARAGAGSLLAEGAARLAAAAGGGGGGGGGGGVHAALFAELRRRLGAFAAAALGAAAAAAPALAPPPPHAALLALAEASGAEAGGVGCPPRGPLAGGGGGGGGEGEGAAAAWAAAEAADEWAAADEALARQRAAEAREARRGARRG
jgi:hypothetical protein